MPHGLAWPLRGGLVTPAFWPEKLGPSQLASIGSSGHLPREAVTVFLPSGPYYRDEVSPLSRWVARKSSRRELVNHHSRVNQICTRKGGASLLLTGKFFLGGSANLMRGQHVV